MHFRRPEAGAMGWKTFTGAGKLPRGCNFGHVHQSNINRGTNIKFEMIPGGSTGTGLIDPSSAPQLFSVICEGDNCQYVLQQAQSALYHFVGMPPNGPLIVYGSKYVPNPLAVTH